jgi:hypothetical protein
MFKLFVLLGFLSCSAFAQRVLHYEFDGTLADSSGTQGAAIAVGSVGYASNVTDVAVGSAALSLPGGNNYLTLAQPITFGASDLWSVTFWARRGELVADKGMVMGDSSDVNDFIWLNNKFTGFRFRPSSGGSLDFTVTKDRLMHHYALVVEGNGTMSLYVDGAFKTNGVAPGTAFHINAIGNAYNTDTSLNFQGLLDDVRIYTNKLTAADVYTVYTNNTLVQTVLDMDFENGLTDKSGAANGGTFQGSATIVTNDPAVALSSKALKLSGDGSSYVSLTRKISFATNALWSVVFRARRGELGAQRGMVLGDRSDNNDFIWLNDSYSGLRFRSSNNITTDFVSPKDTKLHHYALVAGGNKTLRLYRDGQAIATNTLESTSLEIDSIGRAYTSNTLDFKGEIDTVKVYSGMLNAASILADYQAGWADDLCLYYTGDQTFNDQSISNNNGTARGTTAIESTPALVSVGTGALSFDGADNSYISLSNPITFIATDPWSVAFWARRGELGGHKGMVAGKLDTVNDFIWLNDNYTGLRFRNSLGGSIDFSTPKDMLLHHYLLVADGAGRITLYLDGGAATNQTGKTTSFIINAIGQAYTTNTLHYGFKGQLDDVRVYNAALDATAATNLFAMRNQIVVPAIPVTRVYVFLQGGQSNGDGRAVPTELPTTPINLQQPQADVDFFYKVEGGTATLSTLRPGLSETAQFGPEITCGRRLADQLALNASNRVAIIKYANGGTSLYTHWKAGGNASTAGDGADYIAFQQTVTAGLAALTAQYPEAELSIEGMTWMQGESDATPSYSAAYYTNMTNFIADVRLTVGIPELPFVIGRLSSGQTALDATHLQIVRNAQSLTDTRYPWVGLLDTDTFGLKTDYLHFDAAGQQSLGYGFADQLLRLRYLLNHKGTTILF